MDRKELKKKIEEGWVRSHVTFELVGNPRAYVEKTIRDYVAVIKKDPQILFLKTEFGEPEENQGLFSTYAETELLVRGLEKFTELCFNYMPASIEILDPAEMALTQKDFTLWMNDLLAKLHEASAAAQKTNASNKMLQKNINALLYNAVLLACSSELTGDEVARKLGLPLNSVEPFLKKLLEEKKILKKNSKYLRI